MRYQLLRELLLTLVVFFAAVPLLFAGAKTLEPIVAPVVRDVVFVNNWEGSWSVSFYKARPCKIEAVYWSLGGKWVRQAFDNPYTRPTGPSYINEYPLPPGVDPAVHPSIVRHECHLLYSIESPFNQL